MYVDPDYYKERERRMMDKDIWWCLKHVRFWLRKLGVPVQVRRELWQFMMEQERE